MARSGSCFNSPFDRPLHRDTSADVRTPFPFVVPSNIDRDPRATWCEGIPIGDIGTLWVFPEANLIFTQVRRCAPTPADATALVDVLAYLERGGLVEPGPTVIHDWRLIQKVPPETRSVFRQQRAALATIPKEIIIALDVNPILRMVLQSFALASEFTAKAKTTIVRDPRLSLQAFGPLDPDPALHARIRLVVKGQYQGAGQSRPA